MEIITIASRKGGNAKSTTAQNLGAGLAKLGRRVLLIDLDSQGNLTTATGAKSTITSADVLTGTPAADAIQHLDDLDIIPASEELAAIEKDLTPRKLAEALEPVRSNYDYIFIDTGAAITAALINALMASTGVIIPVQCDVSSAQGVQQIYGTIQTVQKRNKALQIKGLLITRYKKQTTLHKEIAAQMEAIAAKIGTKVYTPIRECTDLQNATARQLDIFTFKRTSNGAKDYAAVISQL